jgi:hypothetical protein
MLEHEGEFVGDRVGIDQYSFGRLEPTMATVSPRLTPSRDRPTA